MSELKWQKERPDKPCVFVGRDEDNKFSIWSFDYDDYGDELFLAWFDGDGDGWGDLADCVFEEYLVLRWLEDK